MMDEDIESPSAWEDKDERPGAATKAATKRQNCFFLCGLLSVCLLGGAVFVVYTNYSSPAEIPVDPFDAQDGTVGDHAVNAKIQEAVNNFKAGDIKSHGGKKPWNVPGYNQGNGGGGKSKNPLDAAALINLRKNRTSIKQNAIFARWNRTHPGQPFPQRYNFTGHAGGGPSDWSLNNLGNGGGRGGGFGGRNPGGKKRPTKTPPVNAPEDEEVEEEDGHHGLDAHEETDADGEEEFPTDTKKPERPPEKKPETPPEAPQEKPETPVPEAPPEKEPETPPETPPEAKPEVPDAPPKEQPEKVPEDKPESQPEEPKPDEKPETPPETPQEVPQDKESEPDSPPETPLEEPKPGETPPDTPPEGKPETPAPDAPDKEPETPPDAAPTTETPPEEPDAPEEKPDTTPETAPEKEPEASPENPPDAKPETPPETHPDAAKPETPPDVPEEKPETPADTPPETPSENQPETPPEKEPETPPEAPPDDKPETPPDAPAEKPETPADPPPPENQPETPAETPAEKEPETPLETPPEPEAPPEDVPDVRQDSTPLPETVVQKEPPVAEKETIAEEVLENEEKKEAADETTDETKAVGTTQDVEAFHAGHVDVSSGAKFEVLEQLGHDHMAFTQGLTYANGVLYESTGLYGKSTVRILDPATADVKQSVPMQSGYFGEGMTFYKDKLVQIIWKKAIGFVYDANDITKPPTQFTYKTIKNNEGWGITYDEDRDEFVITDGSPNLMFWDPECWKTGHCEEKADKPSVPVTRLNGSPANELNEIEYWRGRVLANVWFSDVMLVIHPETGKVEKEYDFSSIFPRNTRNGDADVFNGISVSEHPDILYVTGKKWDRMFKVKLLV